MMGTHSPGAVRLSRAQVREIDRRAVEQYGIPGVVLMENAARAVSDAAMEMLGGSERRAVMIVCGGGNNGGDGLAVARHLHNRGCAVQVALAVEPGVYRNEALVNWGIVRAMGLAVITIGEAEGRLRGGVDLVVDALFGTGLSAPPREPGALRVLAGCGMDTLSIDIPSGMDCDTGEVLGDVCVRARRTVTFVAEKIGFANPKSRQYLGDVTVGDIGCPRELIAAVASA